MKCSFSSPSSIFMLTDFCDVEVCSGHVTLMNLELNTWALFSMSSLELTSVGYHSLAKNTSQSLKWVEMDMLKSRLRCKKGNKYVFKIADAEKIGWFRHFDVNVCPEGKRHFITSNYDNVLVRCATPFLFLHFPIHNRQIFNEYTTFLHSLNFQRLCKV